MASNAMTGEGSYMLPYAGWAFDIDGTLLDSAGVLRPRTIAALHALRARGALLLTVTALPRRYALVKLANVPYLCDRGVFLGGGHLLDGPGGYSHEVSVDLARGCEILSALEQVDPRLQILIQFGDSHHALRHELAPELVATWGYDERALVPYGEASHEPYIKIVAWDDELELDEAYQSLRQRFSDCARFYLTDGGHSLQVTAVNATKGLGLLQLLARLGVDPAAVIAFGDGAPDAEMLAVAGTGVAMGNGVDEVRRAASILAPSNDDDGVAVVIEHLLSA